MQIHGFPISLDWYPLPLLLDVDAARDGFRGHNYPIVSSFVPASAGRNHYGPPITPPIPISPFLSFAASSKYPFSKICRLTTNSSEAEADSLTSPFNDDDSDGDPDDDEDFSGIETEIEKTCKNCRRIRSKVAVQASLHTVWNILTDYERLADFIPGLAVCQLLDKRDNFARLFQIGQQNLAFGLKFNAKGVVDCYEKDLEILPFGQRRDIEFKMIEGDFQLFEGKWSIEQGIMGRIEQGGSFDSQESHTTLSYVVDVKPKMWLPIQLVEGRLCREIKMNLSCIREEAQRAFRNSLPAH